MSKKKAGIEIPTVTAQSQTIDTASYLRITVLWGICLLIVFTPFFRGLFFPVEQQKALLLVIILFWVTCLWKWLNSNGQIFSHPVDYFLLALPVVYVLSSINPANTGLAIDEVVKALLYFFVYWIITNIVITEKDTLRVLKVICLAGMLASLAGLGVATELIKIKDGFLNARIYSTFQYPNALASYLMVSFFISFYLWLRKDDYSLADIIGLHKKGLPGFLLVNLHGYIYISLAYIIMLSFIGAKSNGVFLVFALLMPVLLWGVPRDSRSPAIFYLLASFIVAIPCGLMFVRNSAAGKYALAWLWVLSGFVLALLMQYFFNYLNNKNSFNNVKKYKVYLFTAVAVMAALLAAYAIHYIDSHSRAVAAIVEEFRVRNALERMYFYKDAIKMISERPLLGWGGGGWQEAYKMFQGYMYNSTQVHSYYFQLAVETGITGILVIIMIWSGFLYSTIRVLKEARDQPEIRFMAWTVCISALALGLHASIDFDLSLSALAIVLWIMWALMRNLSFAETNAKINKISKQKKKPTNMFICVSIFSIVLMFGTTCLVNASTAAKNVAMRVNSGDLPGLVTLMESAVKNNPWNSEYKANLSSLYMRQGKLDQAINQMEMAVAIGKYNAVLYAVLSDLYMRANTLQKSVAMAERAVQLAPFQTPWYDQLSRFSFYTGLNLKLQGKSNEADEYLKKAAEVNGMIEKQASKMGPLEKRLLRDAPMLAPTPVTLLYSGAVYCIAGEFNKAEPILLAVTGDDRAKTEALMWLSYLYQREGKQAESVRMVTQAKAINPDAEKQYAYIQQVNNFK